MKKTGPKSAPLSPSYRRVTGAVGVFFTAIAIAILVVSELTVAAVAAAAVIGVLGIDAMVSAYRKTSSLLSRIGPLP